ncbi:hypothetical protein Tco_1099046, partial [Tanacetum coccineum]
GNSREEHDDTEDDEGNHDGDGNNDDDDNDEDDGDDNDDDDDDGDDNDGNDDDDSDHERTKSDKDENPDLNQFNEEHEEEENVDEFTDKEDDEENEEEPDDGEELYKDINVNLRQEDVEMTDADQGGADQHKIDGPIQSSSVPSNFTKKLLNFKNVSPADNKISSLMDNTVRTEEPSGKTSTLFTVPITVILTTIPPPPHFFNPLRQQKTPYPTPTASEVTTAFPALPDFAFVFRFNDRVTNLERELLEMKQVDQYAQDISLIPAIIDRYIDNKLVKAIHKAIQSHNAECREEAQAEKQE